MSTMRKAVLVVLFLSLLPSQPVLGWVGNIFNTGSTPLDFSDYWDQVTPENGGKWASCEQSRDSWNTWSWCDGAYNYANSHSYPFKEHCLVWGHSSCEPGWICGLSQSEQRAEVLEWMDAFGNRYNPDFVDVVNEPLHDPPCYMNALGGSGSTGWDWVLWVYERVDGYMGGVKILNDYGLLNSTSNANSIKNMRNICSADAVGAEGHGLESTPASTISSCFSTIGGSVYVSELDIRGSDSEQLSIYQSIFPTLYNNSSGTTLWGYIDGSMWRNEAHLIKTNGNRRPAMDWLYANYLGGTTTTTSGGQSPYPGPSAHPIPGRIEAENYDTGGEGTAYHDTTGGNEGGDYRSDDVDVETCGEGGYNVGWTVSGEWLEYTVDVDTTDMYDIEIRVASESAGGNFHIEFDGGNVTGTLSFSATGGWQNYTSVFAEDISLSGGQQIMRFSIDSSNWNVTWIEFTSAIDLTPPDAPTGLSAMAGDGTVWLDWNDNDEDDLAGYNVYRSTTLGGGPGGYNQINGTLVTLSEYTDDTVTNGTTYYYVVTAEDESSNESGYSNEDLATPIDTTPPAAPTGLSATAGDGTVGLDWNDNGESDLDGYNVYRSLTSGSGYTQLNGPLVALSEYTDDTVTNGTTYYYVVTAEDDSSNESGYSNEDLATPTDMTPPAPPIDLSATAGDGTVGLDWNDNNEPDLAGYNVYRSLTSGSGYTKLNGPLVAVSEYTDDTVTNGTTYYYVVTAEDANSNESGYSNEDLAMPTDMTPPAAPTGLVATAGYETVSLDWNDNNEPDLAGYNVYRSLTSGSGYVKQNGPLVTISEYVDDTVTNGIPYFYVVRAVDNNDLESGYSNEDSATPDYQNCADVQAGGDGLTSDLDGDCYVDYVDLEIIAYYWLDIDCSTSGDCEGADFEPDDDVDFADFSTFGLQWLYCNDPEDSSCTQNW